MIDQSMINFITGLVALVGAITGPLALFQNRRHKTRDLRMKVRDVRSDFNAAVEEASSFLPYVNKSHQRVLNVTGNLNSGVWVKWEQDHEASMAELESLSRTSLLPESRYASLRLADLEKERSRLYELNRQIKALLDRYRSVLAEDDRERERIKARHNM